MAAVHVNSIRRCFRAYSVASGALVSLSPHPLTRLEAHEHGRALSSLSLSLFVPPDSECALTEARIRSLYDVARTAARSVLAHPLLADEAADTAVFQFFDRLLSGRAPDPNTQRGWVAKVSRNVAFAVAQSPRAREVRVSQDMLENFACAATGEPDELEKPSVPRALAELLDELGPSVIDVLTTRQLGIAEEVASGVSIRAIARDLGIEPKAVRTEMSRIANKLRKMCGE